MRLSAALSAAVFSLVTTSGALAQDSVSNSGIGISGGGDAVEPWADVFNLNGPEQQNAYVVDLVPLSGSWGSEYGIAPLVKSGKTEPFAFFNALMGGTGISRDLLTGVEFSRSDYMFWDQAGFGVNGDVALNTAGTDMLEMRCAYLRYSSPCRARR